MDDAAFTGTSAAVDRFADLIGAAQVRTDIDATVLTDWRGRTGARALCRLRPGATAEVAAIMAECSQLGLPVIPVGGHTGLVGGALPEHAGTSVLLDLGRLNTVREVDARNDTMTIETGCTLQQAQEAAAAVDRLFPLSLGAEGTATIGGNLSTNAGGVMTIRYGNMRDLVLGLEAVLPDGRVWHGLRRLRKANLGYDLKHLFIGAEGTLGVITAAVLKLFPAAQERETALAIVADAGAAVDLFGHMRRETGGSLFAFEIMARTGVELAQKHRPDIPDPLGEKGMMVLIDCASSMPHGLRETLERALASSYEAGLIKDAALAESETQRAAFWRIREAMPEAPKPEGGSLHFDVSVPVSAVPELITKADAALAEACPGIRTMPFGHIGDGNIHYTLIRPEESDGEAFLAQAPRLEDIVYDTVLGLGGAISAEHGIGTAKRERWAAIADATELDTMRRVKQALDAQNIMNPGKVI